MKSINQWIIYISELSNKELENINDLENLEFKINNTEQLDNKYILEFSEKIKGLKIEEEIWEIIICFYKFKFPDELAIELIDRSIAVLALGHSRQSDKVMFKLFNLVEESLLTIGKEFYTYTSRTNQEFKDVLLNNLWSKWLVESLAYEKASNIEKEQIFLELINNDNFRYIRKIVEDIKLCELAETTNDVNKLNELFRTDNPKILKALSKNINTPEKILKKLSEINGIKFSKEIRLNAKKLL